MRGFSHTPRTHSLAQAGAYPDLPVLRLSNLRAVDVFAASEERSEQGDLRFRRRSLIDRRRDQVHEVDLVCSARRNAAWSFSLHAACVGGSITQSRAPRLSIARLSSSLNA
jgi:hypothetical protein